MTEQVTGMVFDIQRFCIHDGPGIRTTVFLKGCPLNCLWCHNPEGISPQPQLSFMPDRCIGCRKCMEVCSRGGHREESGKHVLDRTKCVVCGACAAACCCGALEVVGRRMSVAEVMAEVLSDRPFYVTSGGGMTLSGGEPLMQMEFSAALLQAARAEDVSTCVETSGLIDSARLMNLLPLVDLFLYDVKDTDPAHHRSNTGADNAKILENLRLLHDAGAKIILRLPIVPGLNDRADHFEGIARLWGRLPRLAGAEIMPYHPLGRGKNGRFGLLDRGELAAAPDEATVRQWCSRLGSLGVKVLNEF